MSIPLTKPSPCFLAWHSGHTTIGLSWDLPNLICLLVSTRAPDSQWFLVRPPPLAPTSSPPCSSHLPLVPADPAQPPRPPRSHPVVGDNLSNSQSLRALGSCFIGSTAFQVDFVLHLLVSFWEGVILTWRYNPIDLIRTTFQKLTYLRETSAWSDLYNLGSIFWNYFCITGNDIENITFEIQLETLQRLNFLAWEDVKRKSLSRINFHGPLPQKRYFY